MSLDSVRAFFAENAPDIVVIETEASSATVAEAAAAHGVDPAQIAKTICLRVGEQAMLLVAGGTARLDNRKAREAFGEDVHHHLLNTAKQEWAAANRTVTDWELQRGFERI